MNGATRILLVDDHAVVREGLRALLEQQDDFTVVGEAADGEAALTLAAKVHPHVVLMDLKMPRTDPIAAIRALRQSQPKAQVLVFTSYADDAQVRETLNAGALGYLLKDALSDDLVRAVRAVADGQPWLHPCAQRQVLDWLRRPPPLDEQLTARERSVLVLIGEGLSNKQIARRLNLTEGTVKGYVSQVLEKLGCADRTQAALYAVRAGIVTASDPS